MLLFVIFKWLRHAADPKRKDFEASGMPREVPHTVATSRDKRVIPSVAFGGPHLPFAKLKIQPKSQV